MRSHHYCRPSGSAKQRRSGGASALSPSLLILATLVILSLLGSSCRNSSSGGRTATTQTAPLADDNSLLDAGFADLGLFLYDEAAEFGVVAIDGDGLLVASRGLAPAGMVVLRLDSDGQLDPTFASSGVFVDVDTPTAAEKRATALVIDSQGRVLVAGSSSDGADDSVLLWRLLATGALDTSFGSGGRSALTGVGALRVAALRLDGQGRSVVVGDVGEEPACQRFVSRFTADGSVDPSFAGGGFLLAAAPSRAHALTITELGKIIVVGERGDDLALWCLDEAGNLESSFGSAGVVTIEHSGSDATLSGHAIVEDERSLLIVAGDLDHGPPVDPAPCVPIPFPCPPLPPPTPLDRATTANDIQVWCFDASGSLVPGFGVGGVTTLNTEALVGEENADRVRAIGLDASQRIVLVGETLEDWHVSFAVGLTRRSHSMTVFRLLPDGDLDSTLNQTGLASFPFGVQDSFFEIVRSTGSGTAVDAVGRIVVAGGVRDDGISSLALWRLQP